MGDQLHSAASPVGGQTRSGWAKSLRGAGPEVLREVRTWVRDVLPDLGNDHLLDVMLVAVELVTNALDHGDGPRMIRLSRDHRPCVVTIEVGDSNTASLTPGLSRFRESGNRGRGLAMIANVARNWGVRSDGSAGQKTVWAEVPCGAASCA